MIHTRVTPEIKKKADKIYKSLGLTTSQAIMLFLNASVNCNGLPFELRINNDNDDLLMAEAIAKTDGVSPSKEAKRIMELYKNNEIDYETAMFANERMYL